MVLNREKLSEHFIRTSMYDDAGGGYCAKGVANILESVGVSVTRGDAYTWKDTLPKNGWVKLDGIRPEDAPPGAVIVYDRDPPGQRSGKGGSSFGHVELVAEDRSGNKHFVSDKARSNPGGTVPENFVGIFINPKLTQVTDNVLLAASKADNDALSGQRRQAEADQDRNIMIAQSADKGTNSTLFNFEANQNPMMIFAAIISALFNIDMGLNNNSPASQTMLASGNDIGSSQASAMTGMQA